jgi:hypothetical protein
MAMMKSTIMLLDFFEVFDGGVKEDKNQNARHDEDNSHFLSICKSINNTGSGNNAV